MLNCLMAFSMKNVMQPFVFVLEIVTILLLFDLKQIESQNNRLWLEIGKELFLVEPEGLYTWKQAVSACKKVQSNLIRPKGRYDYANLKDAIQRNFYNYSSLWSSAQVKTASFFHHFGLDTEEHNRQKCYKFDNSSAFKFLPENCSARLGFICEKALLQSESIFYNKNMVYFIQPRQKFTCVQAYEQCAKRQMLLVLAKDHASNKLLRDFLFINYGSNINFWFGFTNETHYNCETMTRNRFVQNDSELGFICQRAQAEKQILTGRHIILLVFVAAAASLAIFVFLIIKCFWLKKMDTLEVPEVEIRKEALVSDIK